jgi:hypothetical protein
MVIYWDTRWRLGLRAIKGWLIAGLTLGLITVSLLHDTNLVQKVVGKPLPAKPDPLTRVRGYSDMARVVDRARTNLLLEGKPVFVIGTHYGITGELSFYLPEARTNVTTQPLVYCISSDHPVNQFYFWPGYREQRPGQNAILVREAGMPKLVPGWFFKWLHGEKDLLRNPPEAKPPPDRLLREFESVTDLGIHEVYYRDRVFHYLQLYECRNLR